VPTGRDDFEMEKFTSGKVGIVKCIVLKSLVAFLAANKCDRANAAKDEQSIGR
jgi:hypothetical protein